MTLPVGFGPIIYLLRHGETEWNAAGRFQGERDSPLTDRGVGQVEACARLLASVAPHVDAMHASPLGRVRQTVAIVRTLVRYPEVQWQPQLKEVSIGSWDGLTHLEIEAGWPGRRDGATPFDWFFRAPGGESYDAAMTRVDAWLRGLSGTVVAVSHGLIGRLIRGAYLGLDRDETLRLSVAQGVVWQLADGQVDALECRCP